MIPLASESNDDGINVQHNLAALPGQDIKTEDKEVKAEGNEVKNGDAEIWYNDEEDEYESFMPSDSFFAGEFAGFGYST